MYSSRNPSELTSYLEEYVFPSDIGIADKIVKPGDFGEILASLIVSFFQGYVVPIHKVMWKFNKDRSVFCTDMIAHNDDEEITNVYYYEVKTRQKIQKENGCHVTVNAHNSLLKDKDSGMNGIADYLSKLFYEKGEYENAKKYNELVASPKDYESHFELFFIIEKTTFLKIILEDLNDLPPSLDPLNVTVVLMDNFRQVVDETYARATEIIHRHVYV